ncbi:hypothetical protein NDA11_003987 [Ustilago hordei]|uniref:Uncharacterized protein n=1 Tax=Ustilago hordei TaxID=120017 RepID=I2G2S6_USTHO|nr:uncharacterized protein UHO2_02897 [Ustilago hordei]KAJ1038270.1 hypothetical protein NDA10_002692 [Ustilago hordei]KAJ1592997.1 hypothetical protein NDA11_003987 [Ustilago hordei]UTT94301.1 hypothetical protein NDA17_005348 [Ustilago hordei]CCF53469.1 uncharacterized protein UHOR_02299 [Ustilago hordei]SYW78885.1 uncharacterized protein UHO2_02897 [Ustilago hordei]
MSVTILVRVNLLLPTSDYVYRSMLYRIPFLQDVSCELHGNDVACHVPAPEGKEWVSGWFHVPEGEMAKMLLAVKCIDCEALDQRQVANLACSESLPLSSPLSSLILRSNAAFHILFPATPFCKL